MPPEQTCFAMMPFADPFDDILRKSIRPAAEANSMHCLRADEIREPGKILDQIVAGISESSVCVADLTGLNGNVVYEVALAHARGKPVILITQENPEHLPFDLRSFRAFKYTSTSDGLEELRKALTQSLSTVLGAPESPTRYLEEILVPESIGAREGPFVIAASPLSWREAAKLGGGFKKLRHTCSDHLGIRGLIQAFGLIFRLDRLPDLLNPGDYSDEVVVENAAHLYCIGSPKANRWSGLLLDAFYKQWQPSLEFKADPTSPDLRNIRVMLTMHGNPYTPPGFSSSDADPFVRDFGILVRGPHPAYPHCVLVVMAGRGSLGTEAACRAATDPKHIAELKKRLQSEGIDLNDHRQAFWAVVTLDRDMTAGGTYEAIPERFRIWEAHAFQHRR